MSEWKTKSHIRCELEINIRLLHTHTHMSDSGKLTRLREDAAKIITEEHSARNMLAVLIGCTESMISTQSYDDEFMQLSNEALEKLVVFIEKTCTFVHAVRDA